LRVTLALSMLSKAPNSKGAMLSISKDSISTIT